MVEYLRDKDQSVIDEYIAKFKIPRKFTQKDIQERAKTYESEQIDFRIEDIIGDEPNTPVVQVPETPVVADSVKPAGDKPEQV